LACGDYGQSCQVGWHHKFAVARLNFAVTIEHLNRSSTTRYVLNQPSVVRAIPGVAFGLKGPAESGHKLMMEAFNDARPKIKLNDLSTVSDKDEQGGFRFIFAGSMSAIRNPRAHEIKADPIDLCLDHLSFASVLLRTFESRKSPPP
jgi:uncharacterized protein (TIGR02391 family)